MKKGLAFLLTGFGIVIVGLIFIPISWSDRVRHAETEIRAVARDNTFPLTPAEMFPEPTVPVSRNAFEDVPTLAQEENLAKAKSKWPSVVKDVEEFRQPLADRERVLTVLERMSDQADWQPHRTARNVYEVLFPEFATVKQGAKQLEARAELRAKDGDLDGAIMDIHRAAKLAKFMNNEPTLIGGLVKSAIQSIVHRGVAAVLPACVDSPDRTTRLLAVLDEAGPMNYYNHFRMEGGMFATVAMMKFESGQEIDHLLGLGNGVSRLLIARVEFTRPEWGPRLVRDYAVAMKQLEAAPYDVDIARASLQAFSQKYANPNDPQQFVGNLICPVYGQALDSTMKTTTEARLIRCAAEALQRHALPDPSSTHDPFNSEAPFQRLTTARGWKLYSYGPNRVDDRCAMDSQGTPLDICLEWDGKRLLFIRREQ